MPRQASACLRYVFTKNNYTQLDLDKIRKFYEDGHAKYIVYGKEVGASGTPHLQGYVHLSTRRRITGLADGLLRAHYEISRGTAEQAASYCKKDGDFVEYGSLPAGNSGSRSDLDGVVEWIKSFVDEHGRAPSAVELCTEHPGPCVRHLKGLLTVARNIVPAPRIRDGDLRDWQSDLEQQLDDPADDRSIVFYVDEEGNTGKTWFQQYYVSAYPDRVQLLSIGKREDLAHAIDPNKFVYLFNVPRGQMEFFQYSILEQLKDRLVFSPKYDSQMKVLKNTPHVVVFSNEMPDESKLSADRIIIRSLN